MHQLQALLFDCDGTLAETERDGHRVAYNHAFRQAGLDHEWSTEFYGEMLQVAGGRERLTLFFDRVGWPVPAAARDALLSELHQEKTRRFLEIMAQGDVHACAGVTELIDEAFAAGIPVAICSTSQVPAVEAVAEAVLGADRARRLRVFAGDMVARKKPDPAVYLLATRELGVAAENCVVIEDSAIGLNAARDAGMACIVTPSHYTTHDDFRPATWVIPDLLSAPLARCDEICRAHRAGRPVPNHRPDS